ncbi:hypothetical protein AB0J43_22480 [Nonomuraea fuscirosea]
MSDQLVATGNRIVDDYLEIARSMLVPQDVMERAEARLDEAQQADAEQNGFGGAAERRQRAERDYDEAKQKARSALRVEDRAEDAARAADPRLYDLAAVEVERTWDAFYALKHGIAPATRYSADWQTSGIAADPTRWDEVEPGAEIHLTYETTGQTIVWIFAGLGEIHPDNPELRIVRYTEHGSWRDPGQVVELAVRPDARVARSVKTPHLVIVQPEVAR